MDTDGTTGGDLSDLSYAVVRERRREIVVEHLLFQTVTYVERQHPGLLDHLEESLPHLGDPADDATKDDEAVRKIARSFIRGLRSDKTNV